MPAGVEFDAPVWLLALPAIAAFLVLARLEWWRTASGRRPSALFRQEASRLLVRLVWCALIVLALAGLTVVRPLSRQATLLVLDASASMAIVRDQVESAAHAGASALRPGDVV